METKYRTARVEIRCTLDERRMWEDQARSVGCSLSAHIRRTLGKHRSPASADPPLVRQIAAIGNNLNQLSRWANTYKQGLESSLVLDTLCRIYEELGALRRIGQ